MRLGGIAFADATDARRHTFGTHLDKGGMAPRVAMAAMRHSSLDLAMMVYTDPVLLDVMLWSMRRRFGVAIEQSLRVKSWLCGGNYNSRGTPNPSVSN